MLRRSLSFGCFFFLAIGVGASFAQASTQAFTFTGGEQQFVVPDGVTSITVTAAGAQGSNGLVIGHGEYGFAGLVAGSGGYGGTTTATIPVTPGESLSVFVGGEPVFYHSGGFNGGGDGLFLANYSFGGSGGGASDVRQGGNALENRVVVAGGGGGGAGGPLDNGTVVGGAGGGLSGAPGIAGTDVGTSPGIGGTQSSGGGAGGTPVVVPGGYEQLAAAGTLGEGGDSGSVAAGGAGGGGGGGGYYGGGGGGGAMLSGSGGGGGSFYAISSATGITMTRGDHSGAGQVLIEWQAPAVPTDVELRTGVAISAAKGKDRAIFTIMNTGNKTTTFNLHRSQQVANSYSGSKPSKSGKPVLDVSYSLGGANITNGLGDGTAAVTISAGDTAQVIVKVKTRYRPAFKRTVLTLLSATSALDPSVSAATRVKFVIKAGDR